jgi:hypothetical protein
VFVIIDFVISHREDVIILKLANLSNGGLKSGTRLFELESVLSTIAQEASNYEDGTQHGGTQQETQRPHQNTHTSPIYQIVRTGSQWFFAQT